MPEPFTIRIFVPDGDPEGIRIIDRMNWTGLGIAFPRSRWEAVRKRPEMDGVGVYILVGYDETNDDIPVLYIGQADGVGQRIGNHDAKKDFWEWAIVFVSTSGNLNRAHATWLEYALIKRASDANRSRLENGNHPKEPALTESDKADTRAFLHEVLQILPLVGLRAFEYPHAVAEPHATAVDAAAAAPSGKADTMIVPAHPEGFSKVFLGEDCWYSVRISTAMMDRIKYVAAYQTAPVSAITHYAPVDRIEPFGESGKFKLVFSEKAREIGPIERGNASKGVMQSPRYARLQSLLDAKVLSDFI